MLFGSVGRIAEAKNPLFQIRTFAEVLRAVPGAYYLMVGDGDMKGQVKALIRELGINDRVIMPGYLPDPAPVYSASIASLCPPCSKVLPLCALRHNARDAALCAPRLSLLRPMYLMPSLAAASAGERAWAEKQSRCRTWMLTGLRTLRRCVRQASMPMTLPE